MTYCSSYPGTMSHYRSSGPNITPATARRPLSTRGFTLVELLITLAVAAILLAVAVPSFRTFIQNAKLNSAADSFLAAIQQARSEAITRGDIVVLCRTADSSTDNCGGSNKNWSAGWLMYATPTASSEGPYNDSADHVLLKRGSPAPQDVTITSDGDGNSYLAFGSAGTLKEPLTNGDEMVAYAICDDRGEKAGRLIVIPRIGRSFVTDAESTAPPDELSAGPGAPDCSPNN